jgi:hypothetical protein
MSWRRDRRKSDSEDPAPLSDAQRKRVFGVPAWRSAATEDDLALVIASPLARRFNSARNSSSGFGSLNA